jgi:hypothetical protein
VETNIAQSVVDRNSGTLIKRGSLGHGFSHRLAQKTATARITRLVFMRESQEQGKVQL